MILDSSFAEKVYGPYEYIRGISLEYYKVESVYYNGLFRVGTFRQRDLNSTGRDKILIKLSKFSLKLTMICKFYLFCNIAAKFNAL